VRFVHGLWGNGGTTASFAETDVYEVWFASVVPLMCTIAANARVGGVNRKYIRLLKF
jgi:hypothetical protein